ncbi:MAG: acyltransferase family protein [Planctomycetota bacterium]
MNLRDAAVGRDNNFNLLRMVAATAVLVSHSFAIHSGDARQEPLKGAVGVGLGGLAVDVFFVASGFLVTASMVKRGSVADFIRARAYRIYPAAVVVCLLTVFVLGPAVTTVELSRYFSASATWEYLAKCSTFIAGVSFNLPGVFESNPFAATVNGSLWSMRWELRCYALLVVFWVVAGWLGSRRAAWYERTVVAVAIGALVMATVQRITPVLPNLPIGLLGMFMVGGAMHVFADRIALPRWGGPVALLAIMVAGAASPTAFALTWMLAAPYLVLWCAYVPGGPIRAYNRVGDYSYGVYLYAFPVQQLLIMLAPEIGILPYTLLTFAIVLGFAALSWHFIEKRWLRSGHGASRRRVVPTPAG